MLDRWYTLQLVVLGLWVLSAWAVRHGGPEANRVIRLLGAVACALVLLPLPATSVQRLVPTQQPLGALEPLQTSLLAAVAPGAPLRVTFEGLGLLLITATLLVLVLQIARVARLCAASIPRLTVGGITVAVAPVSTPRTLWLGRHWVLLDPSTAADPVARDLAVRHELQHIRHRDTAWAWVSALLCAACAPNPAVWLLAQNLAELDEHGVDHALVHRRSVSPRAYGRLLLGTAAGRPSLLTLAAGLSPKTPLHRRLQMLESARPQRILPWILTSLLLGSIALARPSLPLSADVSSKTVAASRGGVVVPDAAVVQQAYDRLTRGEGAGFVAKALERRPAQRRFIQDALAEAGLPEQLEAVALIESGYDDQLDHAPGAGLWMFIPSTARTYGLTVDETRDERLDRSLETRAAMALLTDLHREFGDWGLALAGYNQGAEHVRNAIEVQGTRDVVALVEAGALNRYVPMVWAAMVVLEEER